MAKVVTIYSRRGCHLCEVAVSTAEELQSEFGFELTEIFIDGNPDLVDAYGEQVPVIHIDGKPHDFFRINEERFRSAFR